MRFILGGFDGCQKITWGDRGGWKGLQHHSEFSAARRRGGRGREIFSGQGCPSLITWSLVTRWWIYLRLVRRDRPAIYVDGLMFYNRGTKANFQECNSSGTAVLLNNWTSRVQAGTEWIHHTLALNKSWSMNDLPRSSVLKPTSAAWRAFAKISAPATMFFRAASSWARSALSRSSDPLWWAW